MSDSPSPSPAGAREDMPRGATSQPASLAPGADPETESVRAALAALGRSASVLAHEIKNPITAVNLALRSVARQLGEDEQEVLKDFAARMRHLELRLRGALAYSAPLDLARRSCAPADLFADVREAVAPLLSQHGVRLTEHVADGAPAARLDRRRIADVLTQLVLNAVEALPHGGHIDIDAARTADGDLTLTVDDDGPGVPTSLTPRLFEPFASSKDDRAGLGLAFARRVIEAHGGSITWEQATSSPGTPRKTTFRIELPARAEGA